MMTRVQSRKLKKSRRVMALQKILACLIVAMIFILSCMIINQLGLTMQARMAPIRAASTGEKHAVHTLQLQKPITVKPIKGFYDIYNTTVNMSIAAALSSSKSTFSAAKVVNQGNFTCTSLTLFTPPTTPSLAAVPKFITQVTLPLTNHHRSLTTAKHAILPPATLSYTTYATSLNALFSTYSPTVATSLLSFPHKVPVPSRRVDVVAMLVTGLGATGLVACVAWVLFKVKKKDLRAWCGALLRKPYRRVKWGYWNTRGTRAVWFRRPKKPARLLDTNLNPSRSSCSPNCSLRYPHHHHHHTHNRHDRPTTTHTTAPTMHHHDRQ